jgi:hypothetical protein
MASRVHIGNLVNGKRLEIRAPDGQRIVVDRERQALYVPPRGDIRARCRGPHVFILLGGKMLQMTTPVAAKVGFALAKNGGACLHHGDVVLLEIGGERFTLLPAIAVQLGAVMMRKADRADDWQRGKSTEEAPR